HPDRHDGVHLDRGPRDFTVSLSEVNVTRREQTAVDEAGEEKGRSRDHLLDVHVAAVLAVRDRPQASRGPARKPTDHTTDADRTVRGPSAQTRGCDPQP